MTLGSWQRTGVILSVVWALGAPAFAWDVYTDYAEQRVETELLKCELEHETEPRIDLPPEVCTQKVYDAYARAHRWMWVKLIAIAILPVALAWMGPLLSRRSPSETADAESGTD